MIQTPKKYRKIYQHLTNFELQRTSNADLLISSEDILGDLKDKIRPHLFLNFYSEQGIQTALEGYGVFKDLYKRGFKDFIIKINAQDPYLHTLKIYFKEESPDHLLGELYVRKKYFVAKPIFESNITGQKYCMIVIEWLTLQDPTAKFTVRRPPIPGQVYPGLKIARKILNIFVNMALRLKTDGLINIPEHYHNTVFYSKYFKYFNPLTEGQFLAMQRDLRMDGLFKATWAVELDCIIEKKSGKEWQWFTDEQILFVSEKMEKYFHTKEYKERVEEALNSYEFEIDYDKFNREITKQPQLIPVQELININRKTN